MDHVLNTSVVAKYMGFLNARGVLASTIKKEMSNLNQSITLISSKHIPHTTHHTKGYVEKVMAWYANWLHKLDAQAKATPSRMNTSSMGISIFQLWECIIQEQQVWESEFKVSGFA